MYHPKNLPILSRGEREADTQTATQTESKTENNRFGRAD